MRKARIKAELLSGLARGDENKFLFERALCEPYREKSEDLLTGFTLDKYDLN